MADLPKRLNDVIFGGRYDRLTFVLRVLWKDFGAVDEGNIQAMGFHRETLLSGRKVLPAMAVSSAVRPTKSLGRP